MESVGAKLKKLRLEKGLSLEEVHKKTKIHLNILRAIEEDTFINLSPIYIKGFLRIYCKFLGVAARDYLVDYKEPQSTVRYITGVQSKPKSVLKTASLKLISLKTTHIKIIKKSFIFILIIIFLSIGLFNLGKIIGSFRRSSLSQKVKTPSVALRKIKNKTQENKLQKLPLATVIRLSILAKEDSWIQLKADGQVVFQNILKKGRSESWEAKNKIELSLGNAGGVDLEVNGKIISNLGRRGQVLKNILITKEGLSIKR